MQAAQQKTPAYFRTVARSVGVPEFWLEDATQDIAMNTWVDGKTHDVLAIRREAIDAARRYGRYSRSGLQRPTMVPLDAAGEMGQAFDFETRWAVRQAMTALTPLQRHALQRRLDRKPMSNLDSAHASAARRRLKRELWAD